MYLVSVIDTSLCSCWLLVGTIYNSRRKLQYGLNDHFWNVCNKYKILSLNFNTLNSSGLVYVPCCQWVKIPETDHSVKYQPKSTVILFGTKCLRAEN